MRKAWNRAGITIGILLLFVYLTACGKTDGMQPGNDAAAEAQDENTETPEEPAQAEENGAELPERGLLGYAEMEAEVSEQTAEEREESGDMAQTQRNYTYQGDTVLTEDNIKQTMKSFLQIEDSVSFYRLESLPLTEKFFNECIEHPENFPYVYEEDLRQMREFRMNFWGIREDGKCVCLCEFCTNFSLPNCKSRCYYVVMDLEDEQIDSMEVMLVKPDSPHF